MISFEKSVEKKVVVKKYDVKSGTYYAKIKNYDVLRFYKFVVGDYMYSCVMVVNENSRKEIRYDNLEIITSYTFERVFSSDIDTMFISEQEFNFHFMDVISVISKI